jgi:7-cyano-7-deazaguanine reductase
VSSRRCRRRDPRSFGGFRSNGGKPDVAAPHSAPGERQFRAGHDAPAWLQIGGYWYPRGGIPIDVFWQTGAPPEGLWLPDQGVQRYRGCG